MSNTVGMQNKLNSPLTNRDDKNTQLIRKIEDTILVKIEIEKKTPRTR